MKSIIVDKRINEETERSLLKLGFNVMKAPSFPGLPTAICSHPDSLFFRFKRRLFTYADYAETALPLLSDIREYHRDINIHFVSDIPRSVYPEDTHLNALYINGRIFARRQSISSAISELCKAEGMEIVNVRQGYPACSVLKLDEKSAVTADKGMAKALSENGIDTLTITEGGIELFPHEYGFIGGASFVFSGTAYFFGDLQKHPDGARISDFIASKGLRAVSLGSGALTDLGGAVVFEN